VNFLSKFHFDPRQVEIKKIAANPGLDIRFKGPVEEASLWEMPYMYTISELYFRKKYGKDFQRIIDTAKMDLNKKIKDFSIILEQNPQVHFLFSEFGTRRRLCQEFQKWAIMRLKESFPSQLVGTSNMLFAKTQRLKAVGTMAHEFPMFYQSIYHLEDSQRKALEDWIEFFRGWLGIALTDTLGRKKWDKDFTKKLMIEFIGQRHDSADPYSWANERINAYNRENIDLFEKTLLFSDNLTFEKAFKLSSTFGHIINVSHGIGTFISNHIPSIPDHKALNQIIKIVRANGRPVAKLSDDIEMKAQCEDPVFLSYAKHIAE
jgi:nicotinate phosphoribosyltransferase